MNSPTSIPQTNSSSVSDEEIAAQLRLPSGELGEKVAERMNLSNRFITHLCYDLMEIAPTDAILEIGFGNGRLMDELLARAPNGNVSGVDMSEDMVASARQYFSAREQQPDLRRGTVSALPFADRSFDKVCTMNTLYFWPKPEEDIREIARVLKPGGRVYIGIRTRSIMQTLPTFQYNFTLYEVEDVERLLRAAGFEDISHVHRPDVTPPFDALIVMGTLYPNS